MFLGNKSFEPIRRFEDLSSFPNLFVFGCVCHMECESKVGFYVNLKMCGVCDGNTFRGYFFCLFLSTKWNLFIEVKNFVPGFRLYYQLCWNGMIVVHQVSRVLQLIYG